MSEGEFLSREQFDELDADEQVEYIQRVATSSEEAWAGAVAHRPEAALLSLAHIAHLVNLHEWTSTPEEHEPVQLQAWNAMWASAEKGVELLEWAARQPNLTAKEKAKAEAALADVRERAKLKRDLETWSGGAGQPDGDDR